MNWIAELGIAADVIGVFGALFALLAWLKARQLQKKLEQEQIRQNRQIIVRLQHGAQAINLPIELRRAELTRAEILGRIGMIPMKEKGRFSIGYLNTPDFLQRINQISSTDGDAIFAIPCNAEEFGQFDLTAYGVQSTAD